MLFAFNCYCSKCRAAYAKEDKSGSSTVSISWRCRVRVKSSEGTAPPNLKFHDTSSPYFPCTGVARGVCGDCGQPVISRGRGLFCLFSFVNYTLFTDVVPSYYFFYGSRNKEITAGEVRDCPVPAYDGDFGSILGFMWVILKCAVLGLCCTSSH